MIGRPKPSAASPAKWDELLERFAGRRLLVVGDVILDQYVWGDVKRICPEAPVPVVEVRRQTSRPGGAGNAAANLAALGAKVWLCGVVGNDGAAESCRSALSEAGIATDGLLVDQHRPTTAKTRVIAHNQQVLRLDNERREPLAPKLVGELLDRAPGLLATADALLLCDYAKGVVTARIASRLIKAARRANLPIVVDPKGGAPGRYRGATLIKPNLLELEQFARQKICGPEDLTAAGDHLSRRLDETAVLVTQGPDGMTLFRHGKRPQCRARYMT